MLQFAVSVSFDEYNHDGSGTLGHKMSQCDLIVLTLGAIQPPAELLG